MTLNRYLDGDVYRTTSASFLRADSFLRTDKFPDPAPPDKNHNWEMVGSLLQGDYILWFWKATIAFPPK